MVNGTDAAATEQVVDEIRAAGGVAVANVANVGSWDESENSFSDVSTSSAGSTGSSTVKTGLS